MIDTSLINRLIKSLLTDLLPESDLNLILCGSRIRQLSVHGTAYFNECLKQYDLSETVWFALLITYAHEQHEILPSELSRILCLTRTSGTRLSDELVEKGWAVRRAHVSDRRKIMLQLTDAGIEKIHLVNPKMIERRNMFYSVLNQEEVDTLAHLLNKLLEQAKSLNSSERNNYKK